MLVLTSPSRSCASPACKPLGYFWMKAVSAARASVSLPSAFKLRRRLELRQADVGRRQRGRGRCAFGAHHHFGVNKSLLTEERRAAEDERGEEQTKSHFMEKRSIKPGFFSVLSGLASEVAQDCGSGRDPAHRSTSAPQLSGSGPPKKRFQKNDSAGGPVR